MKMTTRFRARLVRSGAAALAAFALAGAVAVGARAGDDDDEAVEIKIATQAPKGTIWMDALDDIQAEVKKQTKVKFVYFPGGALGDEKTIARKIQLKSLGGGLFTGIGLGEILAEVRILELPFFYDNFEEIDKVKDKLEPTFTADFEKQGYVFLGWAEVGWAYIFSKEESKNLEDLKKRKIWLWQGDPLAEATFKEFGLSGTPLALADVLHFAQHEPDRLGLQLALRPHRTPVAPEGRVHVPHVGRSRHRGAAPRQARVREDSGQEARKGQEDRSRAPR